MIDEQISNEIVLKKLETLSPKKEELKQEIKKEIEEEQKMELIKKFNTRFKK